MARMARMDSRGIFTTENTECTEGRAELDEKKEGPEEMERLHFLRPAWFLLEIELCALSALCGERIGGEI